MITYDVVSNPSHASARIIDYLPESADISAQTPTSNLIYENGDLELLRNDSIYICENGLCQMNYIGDILSPDNYEKVCKKMVFRL